MSSVDPFVRHVCAACPNRGSYIWGRWSDASSCAVPTQCWHRAHLKAVTRTVGMSPHCPLTYKVILGGVPGAM